MDEFKKLISDSKPTLVDFFATWCGPCKAQAPVLEDVKKRIGDAANIIKIDVDKNQAVAAEYNVRSIPTLIIFRGGEAIWRGVGLHDADTLVSKLTEYANNNKSDEVK